MSHKPALIAERFWRKIDKSGGPDACWPWVGGWIDDDGYGRFDVTHSVNIPASKMAYELTHGKLPKGMLACHTCDNRLCCNPAHIYAGTHADNNKDTFRRRRRSHKGEANPPARLDSDQVTAIRQLFQSRAITQKLIAQICGVDHTTISCIVRRKSWTHF